MMWGNAVNVTPGLERPPTLTTTGPAPGSTAAGTDVWIVVLFQLEVEAVTPLNVSVPAVFVNPVPVIVTGSLTIPLVTLRDVMFGTGLGTVTVESAFVSMSSSPNVL